MSVSATTTFNSNALASPVNPYTYTNNYTNLLNTLTEPSPSTESTNTDKKGENKKTTLQENLLKLGFDGLFSAVIMYITYYKGLGLGTIEGKLGKTVNPQIQEYLKTKKLKEELKSFNNCIKTLAIPGKEAQEAFHKYWEMIKEHGEKAGLDPQILKQHKFHNKDFRKAEAGLLIGLLSWVRTVFFAPNTNWNNLNFFSPQALLSLGFPLFANTGYWYVYDKHKPGQIPPFLFGMNLITALDPILDVCKAGLKAMKRFVASDDMVKNIVLITTLFLAALGIRGLRNDWAEKKLMKMLFKTNKFGPTTNAEAWKASGARAVLKMILDTSMFSGIVGALTLFIDYLFPNSKQSTSGYSYFNSTNTLNSGSLSGLTSQQLHAQT